MKNTKELINKFQSLKGVSFISLNNYKSKSTGEIANHVINVNLSVYNAKQNDFEKLQQCNNENLIEIANTIEINLNLRENKIKSILLYNRELYPQNPIDSEGELFFEIMLNELNNNSIDEIYYNTKKKLNNTKILNKINHSIAFNICKLALQELLTSAEKNLSKDPDERSTQSKAQTDTYISLTPAIRLHKETLELHIFGQAINKTIITEGEHKEVKSNDKTIAKNAIKKYLDLRSDKFRDFIVTNIENVKVSKDSIDLI